MKPVSAYQKEQFSRATYRAEFKKQAPTFDPRYPPKSWVGFGNFTVFNYTTGKLEQIDVPKEREGVNLPGVQAYPPYVIGDTVARDMSGAPVRSVYLSLESDARALMVEMGGSDLRDEGSSESALPVAYGEESRRLWHFMVPLGSVNAGALLNQKYARGIGAPGHWNGLTWVSELPVEPFPPEITVAPVKVPVELPAGATIVNLGPMQGWQVQLADEVPAPSVGGGLTESDRVLIRTLIDRNERLLTKFGG